MFIKNRAFDKIISKILKTDIEIFFYTYIQTSKTEYRKKKIKKCFFINRAFDKINSEIFKTDIEIFIYTYIQTQKRSKMFYEYT